MTNYAVIRKINRHGETVAVYCEPSDSVSFSNQPIESGDTLTAEFYNIAIDTELRDWSLTWDKDLRLLSLTEIPRPEPSPENANAVLIGGKDGGGVIRRYDAAGQWMFTTDIRSELIISVPNILAASGYAPYIPEQIDVVQAEPDGDNTVIVGNGHYGTSPAFGFAVCLDANGNQRWQYLLSYSVETERSLVQSLRITDHAISIDYSYSLKNTEKGSPDYEQYSETVKTLTVDKDGATLPVEESLETIPSSEDTVKTAADNIYRFSRIPTSDGGFFVVSDYFSGTTPIVRYYSSLGLYGVVKDFLYINRVPALKLWVILFITATLYGIFYGLRRFIRLHRK